MKSNKKEKLQANLTTLQLNLLELKSTFNPDVLTYNQYINIEKEIRVLENEVNQLQFALNYGFDDSKVIDEKESDINEKLYLMQQTSFRKKKWI